MSRNVLAIDLSRLGLNAKTSREVIEIFFTSIVDTLKSGKPVRLSNFGKFSLRKRKAKTFKNPKTGEINEIKEKKSVVFTPSRQWREMLNQ